MYSFLILYVPSILYSLNGSLLPLLMLTYNKGRDLNQQKRPIVFFHLSDWYHRPGRPAEGAECYAADAS